MNDMCGATCPNCGHCCANLLAPYIDLAPIAYKVICARCGTIYIQTV